MKGYNNNPIIERDMSDVVPMRYNLVVKIHDETPATKLILPQSEMKNHTAGRHGTIMAMGDKVANSMTAEGLLSVGDHIIFDESVSIDDPNRCFKNGESLYIMFDVGTVLAKLENADLQTLDEWAGVAEFQGRQLCAIGNHIVWVLSDRLIASRPAIGEQQTASGVILPAGDWLEDVGGIKFKGGKYSRQVGGVVEAAGLGEVVGMDIDEEFGTAILERGSMSIKAGDHILFPKYGHTDITIDGIPCVIMKQDKVLATFTPKESEEKNYERVSESLGTGWAEGAERGVAKAGDDNDSCDKESTSHDGVEGHADLRGNDPVKSS